MADLERVKREGVELAPGVYDWCQELHVDLEAFIVSAGGDPASERDQETAMKAIERISDESGIPAEFKLK